MGFGTGGGDPGELFRGAVTGLLQGVTALGVNYAVEEWDVNPLLANLAFSAVAVTIQSALPSDDPKNKDMNLFERIADTYIKNALTFLGYNPIPLKDNPKYLNPDGTFDDVLFNRDMGNYYWQEAAYVSQILDFSDIVQQKGIEEALNIYGTSFFNSVTVNAIVETGLTIGEYFQQYLDQTDPGQTELEVEIRDKDGKVVGKALFRKNAEDKWDLVGREDINGYKATGDIYVDASGKIGFSGNATLIYESEDYVIYQTIEESKLVKIEQKNLQGNTVKEYIKNEGQETLVMGNEGQLVDGRLIDHEFGIDVTYEKEEPIKGEFTINDILFNDPTEAIYNGLTAEQLKGTRLYFEAGPNETYQYKILPPTTDIFSPTPYSVPFYTSSIDDGFDYINDLGIQGREGYVDLVDTLFSTHLGYTPAEGAGMEAVKDYFGRLGGNILGALTSEAFAANAAGPEIWANLTGATYSELLSKVYETSNVNLLAYERIKLKDIGLKFNRELAGASVIYEHTAKYDNVTLNDVNNAEMESTLLDIGSDFLQGCLATLANSTPIGAFVRGALSVAGVLDSTWDKVQVYDPTQRRYEVKIEYGSVHGDGWPHYSVWLKFREGQYTTTNGETGYGIIQATYQKSIKYDEYTPWQISETIRTHEGEDRSLYDPL